MTTTIRGKSGKSALRELLDQHDDCQRLMEIAVDGLEPFHVTDDDHGTGQSFFIQISKDEFIQVLQARLQVINTKLENLGLKIGDEVETAQ